MDKAGTSNLGRVPSGLRLEEVLRKQTPRAAEEKRVPREE